MAKDSCSESSAGSIFRNARRPMAGLLFRPNVSQIRCSDGTPFELPVAGKTLPYYCKILRKSTREPGNVRFAY